ncbi:hypothetical protein SISSUDRAFT_1067904 [Sistotremastrum suecicum HHB10207 ss-3]|uniref:CoA carboxyltransferase N-terminal domain-containing protein n=1 Tax=Sistotremastrum suecicum HHB10207 ss-3 TaxID=1314776 RepID=A0A165WKM9_9AGAM|nr:hypothetical protein SISSUDRAFT_1067904 [Sistotremastrum suecicum HHB10207 ss-3]
MPLVASVDGTVQFIKQPGVSLKPGDVFGILSLDDPDRVNHAKPLEGQLPKMGLPSVVGSESQQQPNFGIDILNNILDGYDTQAIIASALKDVVDVMRNAKLFFSEASAVLSVLSGRIPGKLEDSLRATIENVKAKTNPIEIPATRIRKLLETYIERNIRAQDRTMFRDPPAPLVDVVDRHKSCPQFPEWDVFANLPSRCESTEKLFGGSIEARPPQGANKNKLVLYLLDMIETSGSSFNSFDSKLNTALQELAALQSRRVFSGYLYNVDPMRFTLGSCTSAPSTPSLAGDVGADNRRQGSVSDLTYILGQNQSRPVRHGAIAWLSDFKSLTNGFAKVTASLPLFNPEELSRRHGPENQAHKVLNLAKAILALRGVRRVSFDLWRKGQYPSYFTLRDVAEVWQEEEAICNIEPALAAQLELSRLSNYNLIPCFVENPQIHIYHAVAREIPVESRFLVRALIRPGRIRGNMRMSEYLFSETDRLVTGILDALEVLSAQYRHSDCNHIAMNSLHNLTLTFDEVVQTISGFIGAMERDCNVIPICYIIDNVSGFILNFHTYQEIVPNKASTILKSFGEKGPLHLQPVNQPYPTKESLPPKRYQAHSVGTTYVYDFPDLLGKALHNHWLARRVLDPSMKIPQSLPKSKELVLDENEELQEVDCTPGNNNCGMGRSIAVIANDITYKIGSFGPQEDHFFHADPHYARSRGLPRVYLSASSDARIGLAEEALDLFSVAWNDPSDVDVTKGVKYLYLTHEAFLKINEKSAESVRTTEITEDGERRHMLTNIIGLQDGLGVECLKGSGLIAGETSRAYDDIVTIMLVTARSLGIGAYLVRLGQRAAQVEGQPIIFTGAPALNKVLGRKVYTLNLQLGGTQIMHKNGVSHLTASSDLEGVTRIIHTETWDRDITYVHPKGPYDPRWFIEGKVDETTPEWLSGFFDKRSSQETLSGWAQTVVCITPSLT